MMTMLQAKGLEFPNVFLTGFEEGLFPSNRCLNEPEELEEERRLCYVAITRAKQNLVISYARQRMLYGRTTTNLPSRFVDELPAESVKRAGAPKPSYSQQPTRQYGSFGRVSIYGDEYNDFSQIPTRPKPQKDYSVHTQPKPAPKVSFAARGDGAAQGIWPGHDPDGPAHGRRRAARDRVRRRRHEAPYGKHGKPAHEKAVIFP